MEHPHWNGLPGPPTASIGAEVSSGPSTESGRTGVETPRSGAGALAGNNGVGTWRVCSKAHFLPPGLKRKLVGAELVIVTTLLCLGKPESYSPGTVAAWAGLSIPRGKALSRRTSIYPIRSQLGLGLKPAQGGRSASLSWRKTLRVKNRPPPWGPWFLNPLDSVRPFITFGATALLSGPGALPPALGQTKVETS